MGIKQITILTFFIFIMLYLNSLFLNSLLAKEIVDFYNIPLLIKDSPLLKLYDYKKDYIEQKIKQFIFENGWWLSLGSNFYPDKGYSNDITGYRAKFYATLNRSFLGHTTIKLYKNFLNKIDYLMVDKDKNEKEILLIWRCRFLLGQYLILNRKIKLIDVFISNIQSDLSRIQRRYEAGFGGKNKLTILTNLLYKCKLQRSVFKAKQKKIYKLLSMIMGLKKFFLDTNSFFLPIPITIVEPKNFSVVDKIAKDLISLSKKHFYPRAKVSLGSDHTWDKTANGFWVGFSLDIPLSFRELEKIKRKEVLSRLKAIKEEEKQRLKDRQVKATDHLLGMFSTLTNISIFKRQITDLLLETCTADFLTKLDLKVKLFQNLLAYYDEQLKALGIIASLQSELLLKEPYGTKMFPFGEPPREVAVWFWKTENFVNCEDIKNVMDYWMVNRVFYSLNGNQIKSFLNNDCLELQNIALSFFTNGISMEILLGEPSWILPKNRYKLIEIIRKLEDKCYPLICNLHLDIEPHALKNFAKNKEKYLRYWLDTIKNVKANTSFNIVVDVPLFFFKTNIKWQGKYMPFISHLKGLINGIVVMNYTSNIFTFTKRARFVANILENLNLPFWIGVSIEHDIPEFESMRYLSEDELKNAISKWLLTISNSYFFRGIVIEKFDDLKRYGSLTH